MRTGTSTRTDRRVGSTLQIAGHGSHSRRGHSETKRVSGRSPEYWTRLRWALSGSCWLLGRWMAFEQAVDDTPEDTPVLAGAKHVSGFG